MKLNENQKKEFKLGFMKFIFAIIAIPVIYGIFVLLTLI